MARRKLVFFFLVLLLSIVCVSDLPREDPHPPHTLIKGHTKLNPNIVGF